MGQHSCSTTWGTPGAYKGTLSSIHWSKGGARFVVHFLAAVVGTVSVFYPHGQLSVVVKMHKCGTKCNLLI